MVKKILMAAAFVVSVTAVVSFANEAITAEHVVVYQAGINNKDFVGQYVLDHKYDYMVITLEEGKLFAQPTGQTKKELFHNEDLEFFLPGNEATITFFKNKKGEVTKLLVRYKEIKIKGEKVG